ncbi:hypothetical protein PTKIN_Ptkin16aG0008800 [Pterospermum kingtungense]
MVQITFSNVHLVITIVLVLPTNVWNICVAHFTAFDVLDSLWSAQVKDTGTFFTITTSMIRSTVMLVESVLVVFGGFPFIKLGTTRLFEAHPHPLVVVKKDYEYPECCKLCGKPCSDLALECAETRCNYIIHFKCWVFEAGK